MPRVQRRPELVGTIGRDEGGQLVEGIERSLRRGRSTDSPDDQIPFAPDIELNAAAASSFERSEALTRATNDPAVSRCSRQCDA
jgi:hypothetical protein